MLREPVKYAASKTLQNCHKSLGHTLQVLGTWGWPINPGNNFARHYTLSTLAPYCPRPCPGHGKRPPIPHPLRRVVNKEPTHTH